MNDLYHEPVKVAVVTTVYYPLSHADVIVSRWIKPFEHDEKFGWDQPKSKILSMYVDQFPEKDISRKIAGENEIPIYDSVEKALTLGGNSLAVDGILLIGEHGDYPINEFGQKMYPRKELFDKVVAAFKKYNKVVPVFCDKHLSWNSKWADEMYETIKTMKIPFMAGSTAPLTGTDPRIEIPEGSVIKESVTIYSSPIEAYGFHSLELAQSFLEQRAGGEKGIRSVTAYIGDQVWEAMEQGKWSKELFEKSLHGIKIKICDDVVQKNTHVPLDAKPPVAFCLEHNDGVRNTHILLYGQEDFVTSLELENHKILTGRVTWGGKPSNNGHFAILNHYVEEMFLTHEAPLPIERTFLTTKALASCMHALKSPRKQMLTPDLNISYIPYLPLQKDFLLETRPVK